MFYVLRAQIGKIRTEQFNGKTHTVVPVVALVEGVLHAVNAPAPEFIPAQEFEKSVPGWNGRPVLVDHPERGGNLVSANSADVLETEQIGVIFNTSSSDGKLRMEAWIDTELAEERGGKVAETISRITSGDITEISTGFFAELEDTSGTHDGRDFDGIIRNIVPDHLALLSGDKIGACSIEDGCGTPRANATTASATITENTMTTEKTTTSQQLRVSAAHATGTTNDHSHALPEGVDTGRTDEVDGHTHSFDQSNDKTGETDGHTHTLPAEIAANTRGLFAKVKEFFKPLRTNQPLSDTDIRSALDTALQDKGIFGWVTAVFEDHFVYVDFMVDGLLQRDFSISEDGTVTLGDDIIKVRPETGFVEVRTNEDQEKFMAKKETVLALISNAATLFTDKDEVWLMGLDDKHLELMGSRTVPETTVETNKTITASTAGVPVASAGVPVVANTPVKGLEVVPEIPVAQTMAQYLQSAPPDIAATLRAACALRDTNRTATIAAICANSQNTFSADALNGMADDTLDAIAKMAIPLDFSGQGGGQEALSNVEMSNAVQAPPPALLANSKFNKRKEA